MRLDGTEGKRERGGKEGWGGAKGGGAESESKERLIAGREQGVRAAAK